QEYRPTHPNLPARQEVIPRPRPAHPPSISRLPVPQTGHNSQGYTRRVTQIDVVAMPRDWRRPIPERKTGEWRNYMLASCFGAVMGIGGYTYLSHSGVVKVQAAKAPAPPVALAKAVQQPGMGPDDAFHERLSGQLFRADVPGPGAPYGAS